VHHEADHHAPDMTKELADAQRVTRRIRAPDDRMAAERLKREVGSAIPLDPELQIAVKGQDQVSGTPKVRMISSEAVRSALSSTLEEIAAAVTRCLEQTPPELGGDILDRGIMLTGGGALLNGLDAMIRNRVEIPAYIAEDPLTAVVRGTGKVLEDVYAYRRVLM